ncbi:MAG: hypothetical protein L0H53_05005 [Candidatus Nitrosocosmicus sp.]|nr:hypothetical protein [Candidatus Nitrosocosmicus sp.]MDN5866057.1 hypothetical protein [Candidatus Nitrosocosmicus sp.]
MSTSDSLVLILIYVIDVAAISIILITMGQSLILLLQRFLEVDSKKFPTGIGICHDLKKQSRVNSDNVTNEAKVSSISILTNGLLFALEFECANAVLKLIIVISSLFGDGPIVDIYNTVIFFVVILRLRMITSFTLRKIDLK